MDDNELESIMNEYTPETENTPKESVGGDNSDGGVIENEHPETDSTPDSDSDNGDNTEESAEETEEEEAEETGVDEPDEEEQELREEMLRRKEIRKGKKRRKKTHGRLVFALIMVTVVISVAVLSASGIIYLAKELIGLDRESTEFSIEIPENSGTEAIANILEREGIINNPTLFRIVSKMKGADGTYIAGEHKISPNMSYSDIIEILQEEAINPREYVTITFPEGIRLNDAAAKLEENGVCGANEFIRAFNSTSFGFDFEEKIKANPKKFYKMEGYFFPDTYEFYLDEDPKNVVKKLFKNFDYRVTPDYYGRMADLGLTLEETMTLASIVQQEASRSYDMKLVASVFHNRLNAPDLFPLLQSDPTRKYAEEVIEPNLEIKSQSMLDAYNTYVGAGLPPGPICSPGIDAIEAVLYPRDTDYYFFCSDLSTGEFFFAETLSEHEDNLVKAHLV